MIKYSNPLGGGGSSTATLPDQISNLACTGGTDGSHGTIDISFTEVPATSFDLLKYYILIYKVGGIPQTPFDGTRITLQKGTAGAKLEHQITGLVFDQLYGVRIYPVSVKNQYQTLAEGATATVTPVNGIDLGSLSIADRYAIPVLEPYQTRFGNEIVFKIADKNHTGYPTNSVTSITDKIIQMMFADAKEPENPHDVGSREKYYGNSRYILSNIHQWLNKSGHPWYTKSHSYDEPPTATYSSEATEYASWDGFLSIFPNRFLENILDTNFTVYSHYANGRYDNFTAKFTLLSVGEAGGEVSDGTRFPIFTDDNSRVALLTENTVISSGWDISDSFKTNAPYFYTLRTPNIGSEYSDYISFAAMYSHGEPTSSTRAVSQTGIRPLCNLMSNFKVKPEPRADGIYEPVWA